MTESVVLSLDDRVATITISREERRNALDHGAMEDLEVALQTCATSDARVIVVTGAGGKSFCAGDDVKAYAERSKEASRAHFERGLRTFDALERHRCLTIAAIEGYCLGGGLELALCCDLRIAGQGALFGLPEILKLNALPSWGGLTRLPRIIGLGRAKQAAFMGERIGADEAARIGLVAQVVDERQAMPTALTFAQSYASAVEAETTDVAKRILNDSGNVASSTASLINLLSERSQAFDGL